MKKLLSAIIAAAMIISAVLVFASCGSDKKTVNGKTPAQAILDGFSEESENQVVKGESSVKLGFGGLIFEMPSKSTFVKLGSKYYYNLSLVTDEETFDTSSASLWYNKGITAVLSVGSAQIGAKLDFDILSMIPLLKSTIENMFEKKGADVSEENIKETVLTIIEALLGDAAFKSENGGYTVSAKVSIDEALIKRFIEVEKKIKTQTSENTIGESDDNADEIAKELVDSVKRFLDVNEFVFNVRFDKNLSITSYDCVMTIKLKLPAEILGEIVGFAVSNINPGALFGGMDDEIDYVDGEPDMPTATGDGAEDDVEDEETEPEEYVSLDIKLSSSFTVSKTATADDIPDIPQKVELFDLMDIISEKLGSLDLNSIIEIIKSITEGGLINIPGLIPSPNPASDPV